MKLIDKISIWAKYSQAGSETTNNWIRFRYEILAYIFITFIFSGVGALFSTCMREDYKLMLDTSQKNYSASAVLGCCEVANKNTAGTLTQQECQQETGGLFWCFLHYIKLWLLANHL